MPNADNITRPITLISYGRSGTSLVHNILAAHSQVDGCGETGQMLHAVWLGSERLKGVVRPDHTLPPKPDHRVRSAKAVRAAFLAFFEEPDKPEWVHKPINVPRVFPEAEKAKPFRMRKIGETYWEAMKWSFPESRNITVLRHPYDVITSAVAYWGFPVDHIWRQLVNMALLINHEQSDINFAISHARLSEDPEPEIRRLLAHVGLPEEEACFKAAEKVYVPGAEREDASAEREASGFSRKDRWKDIDTSEFKRNEKNIIRGMWHRFGEDLRF